jgi:hypothetical protein
MSDTCRPEAPAFDLASDETSGSPANDFPVQETMTAAKTAAIRIDVKIEPDHWATFNPRTFDPRIGTPHLAARLIDHDSGSSSTE